MLLLKYNICNGANFYYFYLILTAPMYKNSAPDAEGSVIGGPDSDTENELLIDRDYLAVHFRPCYVTYGWKN